MIATVPIVVVLSVLSLVGVYVPVYVAFTLDGPPEALRHRVLFYVGWIFIVLGILEVVGLLLGGFVFLIARAALAVVRPG